MISPLKNLQKNPPHFIHGKFTEAYLNNNQRYDKPEWLLTEIYNIVWGKSCTKTKFMLMCAHYVKWFFYPKYRKPMLSDKLNMGFL